ncbi:GTP-binding protein 1 [Vanrija pseudolonga]|uniref:GTP-binding protein 1 n=1 Tax=Vanrija pseudolonga TaxID=143232 RepID=A0AAF0YAR9_9TREE|nr:GTP-binding protein 1 [Vanrija pseudolonga]
MTTLRSFQAEIANFSHEKQIQSIQAARDAHAAAEQAKHHKPKPAPQPQQQPAPTSPIATGQVLVESEVVEEPEVPIADLLINAEDDALQARLASSLLRRRGEIIVSLGLHPDDGHGAFGDAITSAQLDTAIARLTKTCEALKADVTELYREKAIGGADSPYGCWLVRLRPAGMEEVMEVRVAVVGNVDAGKSTTLGVLTRGGLDDGRGKARIALFRHPHEVETGRTSSVGGEILGFTTKGQPIFPEHISDVGTAKREKLTWEEICKRASKVVSFIDLAGHERYFKTTLYGLSGCAPDYVMLMVGGNAGLIGMSKEHLGVALALNVPIAVCVTKIDMTPPNILEQTINMLVKVLKSPGCRRAPFFVENPRQAVDAARRLANPNATGPKLCPIFMVSNVTGHNLPNLRTFLDCLPSSQMDEKYVADAPFEFQVSDVFSVPFVGTVVSGVATAGTVKPNDQVLLGPDSLGHFIPTVVKTIERKRARVDSAEAGQSVALALKRIRRPQVRKGMVLVAKSDTPPKAVMRFEGMVMVLHHSSTIQPKYTAMLHCGPIRQTVRIVSLDHPSGLIRTGDRSKVVFEFISHAEYVKEGQLILLREAKTKVLGVVTKVL